MYADGLGLMVLSIFPAYNDYWDQRGKTLEDVDRYRVVIENDTWTK